MLQKVYADEDFAELRPDRGALPAESFAVAVAWGELAHLVVCIPSDLSAGMGRPENR